MRSTWRNFPLIRNPRYSSCESVKRFSELRGLHPLLLEKLTQQRFLETTDIQGKVSWQLYSRSLACIWYHNSFVIISENIASVYQIYSPNHLVPSLASSMLKLVLARHYVSNASRLCVCSPIPSRSYVFNVTCHFSILPHPHLGVYLYRLPTDETYCFMTNNMSSHRMVKLAWSITVYFWTNLQAFIYFFHRFSYSHPSVADEASHWKPELYSHSCTIIHCACAHVPSCSSGYTKTQEIDWEQFRT